jgi:membrane protein implicated in regulation of membrane protease activity
LIVALVLGIAETFSLAFLLVMFAGGAVVATIVTAAGASDAVQVLVFILASLVLLILVRPVAMRHRKHGALVTGPQALVGQRAVTLSEVDPYDGRVRLNGAEWSARTTDESPIVIGTVVEVVQISGATAVVRAVSTNGANLREGHA